MNNNHYKVDLFNSSAHDKKQEWEHSAEHDRLAMLMLRAPKGG
jgi:hypothetical protein